MRDALHIGTNPRVQATAIGTATGARSDPAGAALDPAAAPAHRRRVPLLTGPAASLAALLAVAAPTPPGAAPSPGQPAAARSTRYRLANGLEVILRRDARLPLVAVHLRYHVGAVDDPPRRRGLAHVVEHLMFEGSRHISADDRERARADAAVHHDNGETDLHSSEYYTLAPRGSLATVLWLESDRMGFLRGSAGPAALARVRSIVAQERRQRRETDPRGARLDLLFSQLFPASHPYHDSVIGPHAAIEAMTAPEVDRFLADHYRPDNATLTIVGDLPADTRALIDRYFADLAVPSRPVPKDSPLPALAAAATSSRVRTGGPPGVLCGWPSPAIHAPGDAALDVLFAALEAGALRRLAGADAALIADFDAVQLSQPWLSVAITELYGPPGTDPAALLAALDRVLARVADGGLDEAEIRRARLRLATGHRIAAQDLLTRAGLLSSYAGAFDDPDALERDVAQWLAVSPAELAATARTLLTEARAVVLAAP